MSRPQFTPRRSQPMTAESYRIIARKLRAYADRLELAAEGRDRHERQHLTAVLKGLSHAARAWWQRHQATTTGDLTIPADRG